jgi:hypothetical protein
MQKKTKYGKLITTNRERTGGHPEWAVKVPRDPTGGTIVTWLDGDVIPGAFYYESFMALKPSLEGSYNDPPHVHDDWDEIIGIYGTNPADPTDLGGEIQLTLGDEVHSFTKSSAVFVPRGLLHGPLVFKKITRPVILVTTGASRNYTQRLPDGWEKTIGSKSEMRRVDYGGKKK